MSPFSSHEGKEGTEIKAAKLSNLKLILSLCVANKSLHFIFQKLSAIPLTAFCGLETKEQFEKYIRFCFIKVSLCLSLEDCFHSSVGYYWSFHACLNLRIFLLLSSYDYFIFVLLLLKKYVLLFIFVLLFIKRNNEQIKEKINIEVYRKDWTLYSLLVEGSDSKMSAYNQIQQHKVALTAALFIGSSPQKQVDWLRRISCQA